MWIPVDDVRNLQRLGLMLDSFSPLGFESIRGKHIFLSWFYRIAWILGGVRDKLFLFRCVYGVTDSNSLKAEEDPIDALKGSGLVVG